jgi:uncharacterized membrane protein (UPF0136 family)
MRIADEKAFTDARRPIEIKTMKNLGKWIIAYGCFLILVGLAGYLSNPERAQTALISGGVFGTLSIFWGVLNLCGLCWARWAAVVTTLLLGLIFLWRASVTWMAVTQGETDKTVAAVLISLMLAGSVGLLVVIGRSRS